MKINFTKKEYQLLVTMIEISDWVMTSHHSSDQIDTEEYRSLRNKILSYTEEMGMKGCYEKDGDTYYETAEYEENSKQTAFIEEYDEDSFWEQLVTKLVDRDYAQQYGNKEVDFETKALRFSEIEEKYANEINEFGLLNFVVKKNNKILH